MATDLSEILAFFSSLRSQMKLADIHAAYFGEDLGLNTVKAYLNGQMPKLAPRKDTVLSFERAFRRARTSTNKQLRLYDAICTAIEPSREHKDSFDRYAGRYVFWRIPRTGAMIKGELELFVHEDADVPFHRQKHHQIVQGNRMDYTYEGPVVFMAHNLYLLALGGHGMRQTILERVNQPDRDYICGMFISEEADSNRPFAAKIVARRHQAGQEEPTKTFIENLLKSARPNRYSLRM